MEDIESGLATLAEDVVRNRKLPKLAEYRFSENCQERSSARALAGSAYW
jgi:hypothetical protein